MVFVNKELIEEVIGCIFDCNLNEEEAVEYAYKKINNIESLVIAERTQHSKKPKEVRNRIQELFGDLPRIELFAREKTEGWDVWGNQV